jgi:tetratricopeptide (TPR) repeat protein
MNMRNSGGSKPDAAGPANKVAPAAPALPGASLLVPSEASRLLAERVRAEQRLVTRLLAAQPPAGGQPTPGKAERRRMATELVKKARSLLQSGVPLRAIVLLRQASAADPENAEAPFLLGTALMACGRPCEALPVFEHAVTVNRASARAFHGLGGALHALGLDDAAIAAYQRAAELAPRMVDAHFQLGRLLDRASRTAEAQASYRRAAVAGRNTVAGSICEAVLQIVAGKFAAAADVLRQALAREPGNGFAALVLAQTLANLGEIDAAIAQYARVLKQHPQSIDILVGVWVGLPLIKKLTEADRPMIADMLAYVRQPRVGQLMRMAVHFALGKAFDDLRDYEQAMHHYDTGNEIRHRLWPFEREKYARETDARIRDYTPQFFAAHAGDGVVDETPVLVIGMPRSGTTLVEQVLSSHALIAGAGELGFWVDEARRIGPGSVSSIDATEARRLANDYLAVLRRVSPTAARVTDKMPFNFQHVGLIRHAFPKARFIHCRRNPLDTCLSIYFTNFDRMRGFVADRGDLVFFYKQYLGVMEHWRATLPPDCFIEVDYDAMVGDPEPQARRLIEFCGLDWDPACLRPQENRRSVDTASLWQVRQPIYRTSLERWRRYEPWLGSLRELM